MDIFELYKQGLSGYDIAEKLGMSSTTVYKKLRVAKMLIPGQRNCQKPLGRPPSPLIKEKARLMLRLHQEGLPVPAIAQRFNVTTQHIYRMIKKARSL